LFFICQSALREVEESLLCFDNSFDVGYAKFLNKKSNKLVYYEEFIEEQDVIKREK